MGGRQITNNLRFNTSLHNPPPHDYPNLLNLNERTNLNSQQQAFSGNFLFGAQGHNLSTMNKLGEGNSCRGKGEGLGQDRGRTRFIGNRVYVIL